jgi:hypothetical protein
MKDACEIDIPPSGNHRNSQSVILKPGGAGRRCPCCKKPLIALVHTFPTDEYTLWRDRMGFKVRGFYKGQKFTEPVVVFTWIFGGKGFRESQDLDNISKPLGDLLIHCDILPDNVIVSGENRGPDDNVRCIKGLRPWYLTREEHWDLTLGTGASKPSELKARMFLQIVAASKIDPFKV